jgi:type VI protein secretion system component Hcp
VTELPDVYLKFVGADPKIRGESNDAAYPESEGWLAVKSFGFGFGWDPENSSGNLEDLEKRLDNENDPEKRKALRKQIQAIQKKERAKAAKSGKKGAGKKGDKTKTLKQRNFTFRRSPGPASKDILQNLIQRQEGSLEAELVLCRAAGVDMPHGVPKDAKTPFLRFTFTGIELVDCKMDISRDQPPSESVEFWFAKVTMETVWTDNTTGEKIAGGKNRITFDFQSQDKDKKALFEDFLEP